MDNCFTKIKDSQYVAGYTAALKDVLNTFESISFDLKYHRRPVTAKAYKELVDCMLKNRFELVQIPDSSIRYSGDRGFELFISK